MEPGGVNYLLEFTYLIASILFIFGLKGLSHPESARRGMFMAEAGMLAAILGTLFHHGLITYAWIAAGLVIGSIIGALMAIWVPMTAMPQRTALSHALGAIAAAWWASLSTPCTAGWRCRSLPVGRLALR